MLGKARFGGEKGGQNPTDRGRPGTKKSLLIEGNGGPLGVVTAGANVPDFQLLGETIEAVVVERPAPEAVEQHLCLDAGYDNAPTREVVVAHGYVEHIRPARESPRPKRRPGRRKARRWVVERTRAWLSKCRALLVRYDKHDANYLGLIQLAGGLLWYRRLHRLKAAWHGSEIVFKRTSESPAQHFPIEHRATGPVCPPVIGMHGFVPRWAFLRLHFARSKRD